MRRVMERRISRHTAPTARPSPKDAWWREMLAHDSRDDLRALAVPTLAITGDADLQVDPDDLGIMSELGGGNVEARPEARLTHILRRADPPVSVLSYRRLLAAPTDRRLSEDIADWLRLRLANRP